MNLTIKKKLFGGFALLLLLLLAMAFYMGDKFSRSNERLIELVDSSSKKIGLGHDLIQKTLEVTRLEKNFILESDPVKRKLLQAELATDLEAVDHTYAELYEHADPRGKQMLENFQEKWEVYKGEIREIQKITTAETNREAAEISVSAGTYRAAAIDHLQRLIRKNEVDIQNDKVANEAAYKGVITSMILLVILCILVAFFTSYSIIKSIGERISGLAQTAERIASREHTNEDIEDSVNDELNPIARSLKNVNQSFREVAQNADTVALGNYDVALEPRSEKDLLGRALQKMTLSLKEKTRENELHNWLTTGQNRLNEKLIGNQELEELSNNIISFLAQYLNACIGAVYLTNTDNTSLELKGQYAFSSTKGMKTKFLFQEGLVGQVAYEKRPLFLKDLKEEHLLINSAVMDAKPRELALIPFLFEEKVLGVLELGSLREFNEQERHFLELSIETIALSVHSATARKQVQELLRETQIQSEELQTQQEELKQMNEELEEQTQNLKQQQEELQMTNEELEEQTQSLEAKNREVEAAKFDVEQKTKQLEISSKYKSEFLANMSHELRTPLNSLLILSKDLSENKLNNLNEDQVESAEIIYKSGHDLLILINEVLDLSRVEAGKMSIHQEKVELQAFVENLLRDFKHQASQKGLGLEKLLGEDLPEYITTDPQRLNQILKNLVSNALKFTEKGKVSLRIERAGDQLQISVEDTGIGIKEEKQMAIFEAFQQADGGTARKYGGTGLGLSISRELTRLLGGEIKVESRINEGSVFTISLPIEPRPWNLQPSPGMADKELLKPVENSQDFLNYPSIDDDRESMERDDKIVLIIEDDLKFAGILLKQAREKGFKALAASTGEDGLVLAERYRPQAIILDIDLPGMNGHQVLAQIKANPHLRHIPVHIASVNERTLDPFREGAVEYLLKPVEKKDLDEAFTRIENFVNRKMKNLLIIEDDANSRIAIKKLIGNGDVKCLEAGSGEEAMEKFKQYHIDCMVLDIGLPDMSGFDLIYKMEQLNGKIPPIIIYTGRELTREENEELQKYADSIIIKGVKSEERLLDETALFLHRTISNLPASKQRIITGLYDKEAIFQSKKVLVVDDDMRNVFALSKVLKDKGMQVIKAEHGKAALEMLEKQPDMDLVLMDIMMPEMDGYEAMRKIRQQPHLRKLPIIALTAKAMKDDKQKCIDAGANDYITKPVDVPRLLSLMQVWLSR